MQPFRTLMRPTRVLPPLTGRWTALDKAGLLIEIHQGRLSVVEACERFDLSAEEIAGWKRAAERHGARGLKVTKIQECR